MSKKIANKKFQFQGTDRSKVTQHDIKPNYLVKNPLRLVEKYAYKFDTFAKQRWLGRSILEVLTKEFSAYSSIYYEEAIKRGIIRVNKETVDKNYIFQNSDFMEHDTMRLEPPILNIVPKILYEDDSIIVVDKPPGVLVHPGAGSNFTTLQGLLIHVLDQPQTIKPLFRLDKFTTGVMIFSKDKIDSFNYHQQDIDQKQKIYLARVQGNFIIEEGQLSQDKDGYYLLDAPIYCDDTEMFHFSTCSKENQKILQGKESQTLFKKIWYDEKSDTSLLECIPLTGRTHQIRVHLSSLGYPILNDGHYGGRIIGNLIIRHLWPEVWEDPQQTTVKYLDIDLTAQSEFEKIKQKIQNNEILLNQECMIMNILKGLESQDRIESKLQNFYDKIYSKNNSTKQNLQNLEEESIVKAQEQQKQQKINQQQLINKKQEKIKSKKQQFQKKIQNNQENQEKNNEIQEKNQENQEKNNEIKEKNQENQEKNNENQEKNNEIQEKNNKKQLEENKENQEKLQNEEIKENQNADLNQYYKNIEEDGKTIEWNFRDYPMEFCLHAYQYKFQDKIFKTELPYWADKELKF